MSIHQMILEDFRAFPGMWMAYVQRYAEKPSPIQQIAEALQQEDVSEALQLLESLPEALRASTKGAVARAMVDFARESCSL